MASGYEKFADGAYCEIWVGRNALKTYEKASAEDRARMIKILGYISDSGVDDLTDTQFKPEDRFPSGRGKKLMVYAVKAYQLRVYGCWSGKKPKQFVCPEVAIKKDNKADRKLLARVAKKVGEF